MLGAQDRWRLGQLATSKPPSTGGLLLWGKCKQNGLAVLRYSRLILQPILVHLPVNAGEIMSKSVQHIMFPRHFKRQVYARHDCGLVKGRHSCIRHA